MSNTTKMRDRIKTELIRRFHNSKAKSKAIAITMKVDGLVLIIEPNWCNVRNHEIENADVFTIYVDLPNGRAALPAMSALSWDELASNIMNYDGVDIDCDDEKIIYYMSQAEDFVAEYDMYEAEQIEATYALCHMKR